MSTIDPTTAIDLGLKLKYRNPNSRLMRRDGIDPPGGTRTFNGGRFKAKTSNAGSKALKGQTLRPRRRAYITHIAT